MTGEATSDLRERADQLVGAGTDRLIAMRHELHSAPELSNREAGTAHYIARQLASLGLDEVRTGIAGHGVIGVLHGRLPGDRIIALRADMDALPVREASGVEFASTVVDSAYPGGPFPVAHACGHDCHMSIVLSAASVLSELRDELAGTVLFVFQPAEEGPPVEEAGGAQAMVEAGGFDGITPTMVFGMHVSPLPKGFVGYAIGSQFAASCLVRIVVSGKQVHGSMPWLGLDPMPAAAQIIGGIGQLYRQVPSGDAITVSIGHIQDVGRFNIIGETVTLWGTIRCSFAEQMGNLQTKVRRLAEHSAQAYGCTAEADFLQTVPPVRNTAAWIEATLPTVRRVIGAQRVVPVPASMGYDDMSVFVNTFGGLYLAYGVQGTAFSPSQALVPVPDGRGMVANHNPAFYADDDALADSVRIHVAVAIDHLAGALASQPPAGRG